MKVGSPDTTHFTPRSSIDGETPGKGSGLAETFGKMVGHGGGLVSSTLSNVMPGIAMAARERLFGGSGEQAADPAAGKNDTGSGVSGITDTLKTVGEAALGAVPVLGNVMSGVQALKDMSNGNAGAAALDALGALPVMGNGMKLAEGGLKLTGLARAS